MQSNFNWPGSVWYLQCGSYSLEQWLNTIYKTEEIVHLALHLVWVYVLPRKQDCNIQTARKTFSTRITEQHRRD
jgi:hypothetical protein